MKVHSALLGATICLACVSISAAQSASPEAARAGGALSALKPKPALAEFGAPQILHQFGVSTTDAVNPSGTLIQAKDGNMYGTAGGGAYGNTNDGTTYNSCIYRVTPGGAYEVVYSTQGVYFNGPLVQGSDGNLYGEALTPSSGDYVYAYNIAQAAIVATYPADGYPNFVLTPDSKGNLYGVTQTGGANGYGSIFELQLPTANPPAAGVLSAIYSFKNASDGRYPYAGVLTASDGMIYGDISNDCGGLDGAFRFNPQTSVLTTFGCYGDVTSYYAQTSPFVEASDGNLYATAIDGGADSEGGIFKFNLSNSALSPDPVYSFGAASSDPTFVYSSLIADNAGNLMLGGMTGGENGDGAFSSYNLTAGAMTELYSFPADGSTGETPSANLFLAANADLYGSAYDGGANSDGTLLEFPGASMGYSPMITLSSSASVAAVGVPFKLTWQVLNAFSQSAQACFAFSSDSLFSGAQSPSGSVMISASHTGAHTYAINCGGTETATTSVTVVAGNVTISSASGQPISSTSYSYGAVPENSTAPSYTLTLTNNTGSAFPFAISSAGMTSSHFSESTTCPASVPGTSSCTITFTYAAGTSSENDASTYTIAKQGFAFNPGNTIALEAHSVTPGVITVSSVSHNYGTVQSGSGALPYTFQVYNGTGATQTLALSGKLVTGSTAEGTYTTTCPSTLPVNEQCSVTYTLSPAATGAYEYDITLSSPAAIKPAAVVKLTANIQ